MRLGSAFSAEILQDIAVDVQQRSTWRHRAIETFSAFVSSLARFCAMVRSKTHPDTPSRLLSLAQEQFGRAIVLVNNAGIIVAGSIDTIDLETIGQMTRVNFDAVVC
jgi:NADP-dependent 3-hydroxy acid dehydrogenase YdfG